MATITDRLDALEKGAAKLKVWLTVAKVLTAAFGLGIAGLFYLLQDAREDVAAAQDEADRLTERLQGLDAEITARIAAAVNEDALVASFKPDGVLAQVQAQAFCTAQAGHERRVMAVHRSPIGTKPKDGKLEPYGAECKAVCANQTNPWNVAMTHVASFGIYDAPPFTAADGAVQRGGLITHRFHPDEDREGFFGPNYCCCSG